MLYPAINSTEQKQILIVVFVSRENTVLQIVFNTKYVHLKRIDDKTNSYRSITERYFAFARVLWYTNATL